MEYNRKNKTKYTYIRKNQELIIFINGSKEFIKEQNRKLEKYFSTHFVSGPVKIINCYEIIEFNGSIQEIWDNHSKVLNTSGEREINEIFSDYEKSNNKEIKAVG